MAELSVRIVVKVGGSTLDTPGLLEEMAGDLVALDGDGLAVVHGGGKDVGRALDRLGKTFTFVDGLRFTDHETIDTVEMVLSAQINKRIVGAVHSCGGRAVGLSGVDDRLFVVEPYEGGKLGLVGQIIDVRPDIVNTLVTAGVLPVISPVSAGDDGHTYNVNADHAAADLAMAIPADDLVFLTDVDGVTISGQRRARLSCSEIEPMISSGEITGGMIPKVRACAQAIQKGVDRVHIIDWQGPGTFVEHLSKGADTGTVITS
jgi:acetylglutamate kinase